MNTIKKTKFTNAFTLGATVIGMLFFTATFVTEHKAYAQELVELEEREKEQAKQEKLRIEKVKEEVAARFEQKEQEELERKREEERLEQERIEAERIAEEQRLAEIAYQEQLEQEKLEQERIQQEQHEQELAQQTQQVEQVQTTPDVAVSSQGGYTLQVEATAYTSDPAENGGWNVTALGTPLVYGTCAVDPNVIPLGSQIHVEGYGSCLAADTGGAIKGNRIDVLVNSKGEAANWGRRSVQVTVY